MANQHISDVDDNKLILTVSTSKFRRLFGSEYVIGSPDGQRLTDIVLFLRTSWGFLFDVKANPTNTDRVDITFVPGAHPGAAAFRRPDLALKAIFNHEKIASPEETSKAIEDSRAFFIERQTLNLKEKFGDNGQVFFVPDRKKMPFVIEGFFGLEGDERGLCTKTINESWDKLEERLRRQLRQLPLDIEDLTKITPKSLSPDQNERQAFQEALQKFMGQHRVETSPVSKIEEAVPAILEAVIYLPNLLGQEVLAGWRQVSEDVNALKIMHSKQAPHWGDYIAEAARIAGVEVAYCELPDFRTSVLERARFQRERIKDLEDELKKLSEEKPAETNDPQERNEKRRKRLSALIVEESKKLAETLQPAGDVVRLKEPLGIAGHGEDQTLPRMAALHIRLNPGTIPNAAAVVRLQSAIDGVEWLVKKRAEQLVEFETGRTKFQRAMEDFWKRHPEYFVDENGKSRDGEVGYAEAVSRYRELQRAVELRQSLTVEQRRLELTRIEKQDPRRDRPSQRSLSFVHLGEFTKRASPPAGRPVQRATPTVSQAKKPKEVLTEEELAAEEAIARTHVPLPISSQDLLTSMVGHNQIFLNAIKTHFKVKLLVRRDHDNPRILIPMKREKQGRTVERDMPLVIMPVLIELRRLAETAHRSLTVADIEGLLGAKVALSGGIEKDMSSASTEVTTSVSDLIPLTNRMTDLQLANFVGVDRVNLRRISEHFDGLELQIHNNSVYTTNASIILTKRGEKRVALRLTSVMEALQEVVEAGDAVTAQHVEGAFRQSFLARQVATQELAWKRQEIQGLESSSIIDRVMLDTDPTDITHTPREFIYFTNEPGQSVFKRLKIKDGYLFNMIKEKMGLSQIQMSENSITLVGGQKKAVARGLDNALKQLEETRNLIIALAHIVSENRYTTLGEYEVAWRFLQGASGAVLPAPRPLESPKAGAKGQDGADPSNGVSVKNVNAFKPEGNQIEADAILKNPDFGIAAVVGPAGTGKTELALINAMQALAAGIYTQVIIATPMETVGGKDIGFLPGTKEEKIARWYVKHKVALAKILAPPNDGGEPDLKAGAKAVENLITRGILQFDILEDMRGNNYEKTIVIVDEAQNTTPEQLLTAVTRICENSKIWLLGDLKQADGKKLQGQSIKVPINVSLKKGFVEIVHKSRRMVLGAEQSIGRFFVKTGQLCVKPNNGLCESLLLDSNVGKYGLAVLDRSDIHRHEVIADLLAIREAAQILEDGETLGYDHGGSLDTERVLHDERQRIDAKKRGNPRSTVISMRL